MVVPAVMLPERTMPEPQELLLSTLLTLPDDRRAEVERMLIPLTRSAALGELAAGIAHDVVNPLFGAIGLVDLLLEDAAPGSEDAARLQLLKETTLEMKGTLQLLRSACSGTWSGCPAHSFASPPRRPRRSARSLPRGSSPTTADASNATRARSASGFRASHGGPPGG
jgi:hypothetical protein